MEPVHLKLELAVHGARLDAALAQRIGRGRGAGSSARPSLDVVLPGEVWVGVPIVDTPTPYVLAAEGDDTYLLRGDATGNADLRIEVRIATPPRFYERRTSRGTPMSTIATVRAGHLVISPGAACGYSMNGAPCRFCLEGARVAVERDAAPIADVIEVVRAAFGEGVAEHVYFNTAVFDAEDGGIAFLAPYIEGVRRHFDTLVVTQIHPPRSTAWIDRTYAMGVDALSYNLEIYDPTVLGRHCIGRARYIGRDRYLDALGYAAGVFPSGTVWSDLVIGLEPAQSTLAGIEALAAKGVVPVASIVRGEAPLPEPAEIIPVLAELYRSVKRYGINMGWVRDLALGITPLEARHFAGDGARLAVTVQHLTRFRLGALAARGLARFRRRLRVRNVSESFDSAQL